MCECAERSDLRNEIDLAEDEISRCANRGRNIIVVVCAKNKGQSWYQVFVGRGVHVGVLVHVRCHHVEELRR